MFKTLQSRLTLLLSGLWIPGSAFLVEDGADFLPMLGLGWVVIWGGVYGAFWALQAPVADHSGALVGHALTVPKLPRWAAFVIIAVMVILIMGLPKVLFG